MTTRSLIRWAAFGGLMGAVLFGGAGAWRRLKWNSALRTARESLRIGALADAEQTLGEFERTHPGSAEAAYLHGVCHRRLAATSKARECLKRAGELGWPRRDLLRQEAMCDFQAGERASESFLLESLRAGCDDDTASEIYECLVKGYLAGLYMKEAKLCLDYWIDWRPDAILPRQLKAELLHAVNDTFHEIEEYRTLVRLDPASVDAHMKLGYVLLESNAADEAREHFEHCRELDSADPRVGFGIAACQRSLGNLAEAEKNLRASLARELSADQRAFALAELGQVAMADRSYDKAVECLENALKESPSSRVAHYALGLVLTRLGRTDEAEAHLEQSRKIDEQNERLSDLMHDIMHSPDDPAPRCEAGRILLEQENHREAYLWLLSALRCDKTHQPTHAALARYYAAIGKPDAAERHLAWASAGAAETDQPAHQ